MHAFIQRYAPKSIIFCVLDFSPTWKYNTKPNHCVRTTEKHASKVKLSLLGYGYLREDLKPSTIT